MRAGAWFLIGAVGVALGLLGVVKMTGNRQSGPSWNWLLPEMKRKAQQLLDEAKAEGLDVVFFQGWRSPGQEAQYQKKGTSELQSQYDSWHTWGAAVDIVFKNEFGSPYWPPASDPRWQKLGAIGKSLGLVWGGDWTTLRDMAHFQLADVDVPRLRETWGNNYMGWLKNQGALA